MPIFTIGYGSRSLDELVQVLKQYEIAYLIDVRSKPYSSFKPEYSKHALEQHLANSGIKYVFMGDLLGGQPNDPSCFTPDGKVDYEKLKEKDFYKKGIERLRDAWQKKLNVVIMCSEQKPEMCHRSKLIGRSLLEASIPVEHIDENARIISQEMCLVRLTEGQLSLFGNEETKYTSRKKYQSSEPNNNEEST